MTIAEIKIIIACLIAILIGGGIVYCSHAERVIGEKKIEKADTVALEQAKEKADEGTKANEIQAAHAEQRAEHDQKVIDDYLTAHPVGAVRLCRDAGNSLARVSAAGAAIGSAASAGTGPAIIPAMPSGNAGVDIGPGLDELMQSAARLAVIDRDRQQRQDTVK